MSSFNGFGTNLYGQKSSQNGSHIATEWITILWLPIIPLRTLRIHAQESEKLGVAPAFSLSTHKYTYTKINLDVLGILATYFVAYSSIIFIISIAFYPKILWLLPLMIVVIYPSTKRIFEYTKGEFESIRIILIVCAVFTLLILSHNYIQIYSNLLWLNFLIIPVVLLRRKAKSK